MKNVFLFLLFLSMYSCLSPEREMLEQALDFADTNRPELEKVLRHYADEPEKRAAAEYLIRNMPRYYTACSADIEVMKDFMIHADKNGDIDEERFEKFGRRSPQNVTRVYDSKTLTADYLIKNIERAFDAYAKPWNRTLPFADFCELILPYRIGDEPTEEWWTAYAERYGRLLSGYSGNDPIAAANLLCDSLRAEGYRYCKDFGTPHLGGAFHLEHRVGKCVDQCDFTIYLLRALGIPCTLHRYYYSSETRTGHLWPVLRDTTGSYVQYEYQSGKAHRDSVYTDRRRIGKVYREHFGLFAPRRVARKELPPFFRNPYVEDVSSMYFKDTLSLDTDAADGNLYLGVFNAHGWVAIDRAEAKNGKAVFPHVEREAVYVPLGYENGGYREVGVPFRFDSAGVHPYLPDLEQLDTVKLLRKYYFPFWCNVFQKYVENARFEVSLTSDFSRPVLLHRVNGVPSVDYQPVSLPRPVKCRYLRYTVADSTALEISDILVYADGELLRPAHVDTPLPRFRNWRTEFLYDGDPLTYFASEERGASVIYDFGREVAPDSLLYITRTDDNYIRPGDYYELFYHAGKEGWRSLGRQEAIRTNLVFDGVPRGALLYLHNLTRGVEEQVFHMENGKQVFVTQMNVEQ